MAYIFPSRSKIEQKDLKTLGIQIKKDALSLFVFHSVKI